MKEIYFGDKASFAIRYIPGYQFKNEYYYAYCHLVLGGQVIGDIDEVCYLLSWLHSVECIKDQINNLNYSYEDDFKNKSDREIFERIMKSDEWEEDYEPESMYPPKLDDDVWQKCSISIDETTDAFLIAAIEQDGLVKFLWEGWRDPCPENRIGILYSVSVDKDFIASTLEESLKNIKADYPNYREKTIK